jgi:hypothetical protein
MMYDLRNPTTATRVIYDGITNTKPIRIAPGETVRGVELADHVVDTLRRSAASGSNIDLEVTESEDDVVGDDQTAPPATHTAALQLPQRDPEPEQRRLLQDVSSQPRRKRGR